jgi:hypothetical protein
MPNAQAQSIVRTALALASSHPNAPLLDVLDLAMVGHTGSSPDFDAYGEPFGDWTDPDSPFGDLLRQAFAADQVGAMSSAAWLSEEPLHVAQQEGVLRVWQALVIEPFAHRYQLWSN